MASFFTKIGGGSSSGKATSSAGEGAVDVKTSGVTSDTASATQQYLNDYNTNREQKIRDMYSGSLGVAKAAQQTALDNNLANARNAYQQNKNALQNAYEQNMSDAQYAMDKIAPQYQSAKNELAAEYERQRRNNNMQAAANGLNTGAGSQMSLGMSMANLKNQGRLSASEMEALNDANKGINDLSRNYNNQNAQMDMAYQNNITDLQTNYQNRVAEAIANNDYQLAAALLDEYGAQYDRTMSQASQLAEFGDFSMYANIYGVDAAQQMEKNWALQNPDLAYNLGKITADDYFQMTGKQPRGYSASGGTIDSDSDFAPGKYRFGFGSGRGYSASRDRAYRGAPGYLNSNGEFVVPGASWSNPSTIVAASGHEGDANRAWNYAGGSYSGALSK